MSHFTYFLSRPADDKFSGISNLTDSYSGNDVVELDLTDTFGIICNHYSNSIVFGFIKTCKPR